MRKRLSTTGASTLEGNEYDERDAEVEEEEGGEAEAEEEGVW